MWFEELKNGKFAFYEKYTDRFTEKSKRVSVTLTSKSNQAQNKAQRILSDKIKERNLRKDNLKLTWDVLYDEWWNIYKNTVKYNTRALRITSKHKIDQYIPSDMLVTKINTIFITKIINDLYYEKNYSYSYVSSIFALISLIFKYSLQQEYIIVNPLDNVHLKKKPTTLSEMDTKNNKYLEHDELIEVLQLSYSKNETYGRLFEFMALTGLRIGEAVALQSSSIKGATAKISSTYNHNNGKLETPKNEYSYRSISLNKRCLVILEEQKQFNKILATNKDFKNQSFIFSNRFGNPINVTYLNTFFRKSIQPNLVITQKNISSHIFRHTHVAILTELGLPLKSIMQRLGHNNPKTTLSVYSHITENMKKNMEEKINLINLDV
ncbi:prophage ps2 probable integrase [Dellaglioa algida]|nr:prophage ps2 probable integrase [Dellaglioa algida]